MRKKVLKKLSFVAAVLSIPLIENIVYHFVSTGRFIFGFSFAIHPAVTFIYTVLVTYLLYRLLSKEEAKLSFNRQVLLFNVPLFLGLLYATDLRNQTGSSLGLLGLRGVLCVGALFTSHLVFLPLKTVRETLRTHLKETLSIALALLPILVLQSQFAHTFWKAMARPTGHAVAGLMSAFGFHAVPVARETFFRIRNPNFTLKIVEECSGFDGICLFLFVFFLTMRLWKKRDAAIILLAGIGYMIATNVIRLTGIHIATLLSIKMAGPRVGYALFTNLFHTHAGWIIYIVAITLFFAVALRYRNPTPNLTK